ncbi:MAG: hypothetical protein OEQ12_06925 [Nitrosopumilus sp.]|nr:hypothetical protein [Nitrosopumilus sp.]
MIIVCSSETNLDFILEKIRHEISPDTGELRSIRKTLKTIPHSKELSPACYGLLNDDELDPNIGNRE